MERGGEVHIQKKNNKLNMKRDNGVKYLYITRNGKKIEKPKK